MMTKWDEMQDTCNACGLSMSDGSCPGGQCPTARAAHHVESLRLNADGYHMGHVAHADFSASNDGIWAEIQAEGREVLSEVSRLLREPPTRNPGLDSAVLVRSQP
jgi:hypothetical protein